MSKPSLSIFISYARTDSAIVDRLEADLRARNFLTWVDRRKLEGGQNWMDELQRAIDQCNIFLIVLSPEAVASKYVRLEYEHAVHKDKFLIPLDYLDCQQEVLFGLNGIQWVNFRSTYEQGLKNLLVSLNSIDFSANRFSAPKRYQVMQNINVNVTSQPVPVVPQTAPSRPPPDLNNLYTAGITAKSQGNLEQAAIFWQQVLDREPNFGNGSLIPQMQQLMQELFPIRVENLRQQAEQAYRFGVWGQAIGAWQALLQFDELIDWRSSIQIAEQNWVNNWMYENAVQFAKNGKLPSAKIQLDMLWQQAPYFSDPEGLSTISRELWPGITSIGFRTCHVCKREAHQKQDLLGSIQMLSGPLKGKNYTITKSIITIGRESSNEIVIPHPSVSRHHARLVYNNEQWSIEKLAPQNVVQVNQLNVLKGPIVDQDIINLGVAVTTFRILLPGGGPSYCSVCGARYT